MKVNYLVSMSTKKLNQKIDENILKNIFQKFTQPKSIPQNFSKPSGSELFRPKLKSSRGGPRTSSLLAYRDTPEFKQSHGPSSLIIDNESIMNAIFPIISKKSDPKSFFSALYSKDKASSALKTFTNLLKNYINNPVYLDQSDLTKVFNLIDDVYQYTQYEPLKQIYTDFQNTIKRMRQVNENLKLIFKAYLKNLILESTY